MKKAMICLTGCFLLTLTTVRAQDSVRNIHADTTGQTQEHTVITRDTTDKQMPDTSFRYKGETDTSSAVKDAATTSAVKDTATITPPSTTTPATATTPD